MVWYFAYGSNMDPKRLIEDRMRPKGVAVTRRVGGRLDGWRLAFKKRAKASPGAGAGNIVPAAGSSVYGTLNEMPEAGLGVLDFHEGVTGGHYARRTVPVVLTDTGDTVEAITYVALKVGKGLRPTRAYLAHLLAGRDLLPADYHAVLSAQPVLE